MSEVFRFETGGLWAELWWRIEKDYEVKLEIPCPHCELSSQQDVFICPWVVISVNEGGYNSTGICLLCILEAAKGLNVRI